MPTLDTATALTAAQTPPEHYIITSTCTALSLT